MPPTSARSSEPGAARARLIEAGLATIDELPLAEVFAGATTAKVAATAGVTTGSFFHHFANRAEFFDALAISTLPVPESPDEQVNDLVGALAHLDLIEVLRGDLGNTWEVHSTEESMRRSLRTQYELWAHHTQPLSASHDGMNTVGDVLRSGYKARHDQAVAGWKLLLDGIGRTFLDPFDMDRIAVALTALFEGLLARQQVDPDAVDDLLFSDVAAALAASLTVPRGSRIRLADLADIGGVGGDDPTLSPQARSGARRRRETRQRVTQAAVELIGDGWEQMTASEIADAANVSNQTVLNLFSSIREVAATTFVRHLPELRAVADAVADEDAATSLYRILVRLADLVSSDPEPARALLAERITANLQRGGELSHHDIRVEVPIAEVLLSPLERLDLSGSEPVRLASMLTNFVLTEGLDRLGGATDAAALAMRLLPGSATGVEPWQPPTAPTK